MAEIYSYDGVVPVIDPSAFVHPSAVIIGDVIIGPNVYVAPLASLRGDLGRLIIGAGSNIQDCVVIHGFPRTDTTVGEDGHIGHGAIIHACTLERNVLVGMNAVIMDKAIVGESSIIAASAFVPAQARIPPRSLAVGTPAKVLRELTAEELAWKPEATGTYQYLRRASMRSLVPCIPLAAVEPNRRRCNEPDILPLSETKQRAKTKQ
ncbi:MAG: transferase hexapeptide repeat family protein [Desulfobulbus sp.]|nr:transferase hexapeptide repeat family protein [Desulfobulbus sp.]